MENIKRDNSKISIKYKISFNAPEIKGESNFGMIWFKLMTLSNYRKRIRKDL